MATNSVIKVVDTRHARGAASIMQEVTEVVSFDIFDTLLFRNVFTPTDIFLRVSANPALSQHPLAKEFPVLRARAERNLRIRQRQAGLQKDPTLDEIYAELKSLTGLAVAQLRKFKKIEIEEEIESVSPRLPVKRLYEFALSLGKTVILCSDMYLPRAVIEAMLEKCGYNGHQTLYLSCEVGHTKKHGSIFGFIERDLGVKPECFIHFGDNNKSDIRGAEKSGWRSMKVFSMQELFLSQSKALEGLFPAFRGSREVKSDSTKRNYALIWEHLFADTLDAEDALLNLGSAKSFGYIALGPFLLSLTLWVIRESKMRGIKKLAFLARDGYLPIKAAEIIVPALECDLELEYLGISRRAVFPYFLHSMRGIDAVLGIRYDPRQTIGNYLEKRFGQTGLDLFKQNCEQRPGLDANSLMNDHHQYVEQLMRNNIEELKLANQAAYENLVRAYKSKFRKEESVALFDVGRKGTFQSVLTEITQAKFHGLYVVTDHAIQKNAPKRSFSSFLGMMDHRIHSKVPDTVLYEALLSERGGSYLGFDDSGSPLRETPEKQDAQVDFFDELHSGALQYVTDAVARFGKHIDDLEQEPFYAAYALENWNVNETFVDLLSEIAHEDAVSIPVGKSLGDYFVSSQKLNQKVLFPPKRKNKRVMIYAPALTRIKGGAERIAARLANHLSKNGFEVLIFTSGNARDSNEPVYTLEPGIIVRNVDVRDVRTLSELMAAYEPDAGLVLASGPPVARIALAFVQNEIPFLLSERASPDHSIKTYWTEFSAEQYFGVYEAANIASVQFDSFRQMFPSHMRPRMIVLPNPIACVAKRKVRREKLILCAARIWFEQKRQDVLLEAFANVSDKFPEWKLAFYGATYGDDRNALEKSVREMSISDRVVISDPIDNIFDEMERAAIFVLPSAFEGFPNALAEALSAGTPSIGFSECPGTNELIVNGVNGRLIDDSDLTSVEDMGGGNASKTKHLLRHQRVERLSIVLEELMSDDTLRSTMSKSAFEHMKPYAENEMMALWGVSIETLMSKDGSIFKQQREQFLSNLVERTAERKSGQNSEEKDGQFRQINQTDAEFQSERTAVAGFVRANSGSLKTRLKLLLRTKKIVLGEVTDADILRISLAPAGDVTLIVPNTFDDLAYRGLYPDIDHAVHNGEMQSGYAHYITHGFYEGRSRPSR